MALAQAWKKYQQFSQYLSKEGSHSPVGFHRLWAVGGHDSLQVPFGLPALHGL